MLGVEGVIPVAVEAVAGDRKGGDLVVADLDAGGAGVGVEFGVHGQAGFGGGRRDALDDDFVAGQGPATKSSSRASRRPSVIRPAQPAHRDRNSLERNRGQRPLRLHRRTVPAPLRYLTARRGPAPTTPAPTLGPATARSQQLASGYALSSPSGQAGTLEQLGDRLQQWGADSAHSLRDAHESFSGRADPAGVTLSPADHNASLRHRREGAVNRSLWSVSERSCKSVM